MKIAERPMIKMLMNMMNIMGEGSKTLARLGSERLIPTAHGRANTLSILAFYIIITTILTLIIIVFYSNVQM